MLIQLQTGASTYIQVNPDHITQVDANGLTSPFNANIRFSGWNPNSSTNYSTSVFETPADIVALVNAVKVPVSLSGTVDTTSSSTVSLS